jgi:tetratricopeptide (TPR) repeat protein
MCNRRPNWKLLAWLMGAAALSAGAMHFAHSSQMKRLARTLLAQADSQEKTGKLDRAAEYLKRYLSFNPGDTDALARYGAALEKTAASSADRRRAAEVYGKVLARDRKRHDVRRRLLDLYMDLGWFGFARGHAADLAQARPDDAAALVMLGRCLEQDREPAEARRTYEDAVAKDPHCIEAWVRLAALLRRWQLTGLAAEKLDEMVRANDKDATAYLERARLRLSDGDTGGAADDLAEARKLDPKGARVLLSSADLAQRRGDVAEARKWWAEGVAAHDNDAILSAGLAALELQQGRPEAALAVVEKAMEAHAFNPELNYLCTEALLQQRSFDKVKQVIAALRDRGDQPGLANYIDARLLLHQGRPLEAAKLLEATLRQSTLAPGLAAHIHLCLGLACEQVGNGERSVGAYRKAVELNPALVLARVRLGAALLTAGATDEVAEQLDEATRLPLPPPETWTLLARARLRYTLTLPPARRDWGRVEAALNRAGANPSQAVPVALLGADVRAARGQAADADAVLAKACAEASVTREAEQLWAARARLAARLGLAKRAAAVLDEARAALGDTAELRLAALECWPEARGEKTAVFLRDQEAGLDRFTPGDRARVLAALAQAHYRRGNGAKGDRVCRLLLPVLRDETKVPEFADWVRLLDLALQGDDDGLIAEVVAELKKLEGEDTGTWWRYAAAARLVVKATRGDRRNLAEAWAALANVTKLRSDWGRAALLGALLDDVAGDYGRALDGYVRAFELGERQLAVVQRLVQLLAERGRYADADDVLRRCQEQVIPRGEVARTAAQVALEAGNFRRAVILARLAVREDTTDPASLLWLGQVYAAAGQPRQAEAVFREVIDGAFDRKDNAWRYDSLDAWLLLVTHLARDQRPRDAEAAIDDMRRRLPPEQQPFALGVCYEALGRTALAEDHYRAALNVRKNEALLLQRLANLYIRTARPKNAEPLLLQMLSPAVVAPEATVAWTRRQLALLLAERGGDDNYQAAVALLEETRKAGHKTAADTRALAFVHASRQASRPAALKTLEEFRSAQSLTPDELFRLARLYEESAEDWPRVRELMDEVLKSDPPNPEYFAHHIANLLKHGAGAEAPKLVNRLMLLEGDSAKVHRFRDELKARPR